MKKKTRVFVFLNTAYLLFSALCIYMLIFCAGGMELPAHEGPSYRRVGLQPVLSRAAVRQAAERILWQEQGGVRPLGDYAFTDQEYDLLYHQTGLGPPAVDEVLAQQDGRKTLLQVQETFFTEPSYICVQDNWFSRREQVTDQWGNIIRGSKLLGVEDGDIIITKCSHVLSWHNGHAALVVDAEGGKLLEAIVIGENTGTRMFKKWEKYPNYLVLRVADASREEREAAARWARENLMDIPYSLTVGFFGTKGEVAPKGQWNQDSVSAVKLTESSGTPADTEAEAEGPEPISGTQCAHLIWRAYAQIGYDLDPDGGWVITPKQLANSPLLQVVQVYGMNPDNPWS